MCEGPPPGRLARDTERGKGEDKSSMGYVGATWRRNAMHGGANYLTLSAVPCLSQPQTSSQPNANSDPDPDFKYATLTLTLTLTT